MGRNIWIHVGPVYGIEFDTKEIRVLSFKQFLPADRSVGRKKHLVELWTDPGGRRTLSVGSIQLRNPGKAAGGRASAEAQWGPQEDEDD